MGDKLPYRKPELQLIDLGNLMNEIDAGEGATYQRFNELADKIETLLETAQAVEVDLQAISESLDALKAKFAKAQFITETTRHA